MSLHGGLVDEMDLLGRGFGVGVGRWEVDAVSVRLGLRYGDWMGDQV